MIYIFDSSDKRLPSINSGCRKVVFYRLRPLAALFIIICLVLLQGCSGISIKQQGEPLPGSAPEAWIAVYRGPLDHLKALRAGQCPMYPSCSGYAREAISRYGPLWGWFITCDRLIRCGGDTLDFAPKVPVNGKWKYYDPLSANAFWFDGQDAFAAGGNSTETDAPEVQWLLKKQHTGPNTR